MLNFKTGTLIAAVAFSACALAQNPGGSGTYFGVEAGAYFPSSQVIKNAFGSTLPRIGLNFINNRRPEMWKPTVNFAVIGASKDGNRFLAIPVTLGIGRQFGNETSAFRPYVRAGAGAAYLDYAIGPVGSQVTDQTIGFTAKRRAA